MRHRTTTKTYGPWLKLVKKTNPKTGRKHYSVIASPYDYVGWAKASNNRDIFMLYEEWREHFDPARNRGSRKDLSWKFTNKDQAEQLITMALLKWGQSYEISGT